jgi:hypothetical protein
MSELVGAGLVTGAWLTKRVLGPTADEIGEHLRQHYSEYRTRNATRVLEKASVKLGERVDDDGSVPPRIAVRVLEEASLCDSEVMAEYFGGILAASRSKDGINDRGAAWAGLVARLSTSDVYFHYLAYQAFRRLHLGRTDVSLGVDRDRNRCSVYLPGAALLVAMDHESTTDCFHQFVEASLTALVREDLLDPTHCLGTPDWISRERGVDIADVPEVGLIFTPSVSGIELFLWAHGRGDLDINSILAEDIALEPVADLGRVEGAQSLEAMFQLKASRIAHPQQPADG